MCGGWGEPGADGGASGEQQAAVQRGQSAAHQAQQGRWKVDDHTPIATVIGAAAWDGSCCLAGAAGGTAFQAVCRFCGLSAQQGLLQACSDCGVHPIAPAGKARLFKEQHLLCQICTDGVSTQQEQTAPQSAHPVKPLEKCMGNA